ncbi:aconitase X [uncultured Aliiroseovarius sp.]|uniref:cis-3-hydroxy-L-proline dehydratase n=1 Tax=uncultured Aliiroseovarius sp. TaxID=1658783 RepID=UPI002598FA9F|nr:aconitase X [uncultured Aliiroseovarius sp.]
MTGLLQILPGTARGALLRSDEGLSFWGGVDASTGTVIDALHPLHGQSLAGRVLAMPTSRGSCTGSGVLLELVLNGCAPAALIFSEPEDVLTLGALIAARLFDHALPVLHASPDRFAALKNGAEVQITPDRVTIDGTDHDIAQVTEGEVALGLADQAMLDGSDGAAAAVCLGVVHDMARIQGATQLIDIDRAHIDGCIYASPANLTFAERMADLGAQVRVPTTTNAISVDLENWREQGVDPAFGTPAAALAQAYLRMGCAPSFTCAPYLLDDAPGLGQAIAWSESNAVIHANTVLGARTAKHPDFLDLCIAVTGRAPESGVYLTANRAPRRILSLDPSAVALAADDVFWPLLGHLAGRLAPDLVPRIDGLNHAAPTADDLKALCAAFGTTSAAPMLHITGHTPEADMPPAPDTDTVEVTAAMLRDDWASMDTGGEAVDLIAIGSPHASASECRALVAALGGAKVAIPTIVTCARDTIKTITADGTLDALHAAGVRVIPDLCWCSITEPVFPPAAQTLMTNSAKYAHYAPGLSGRAVRFAGLSACARAALSGHAPHPTESPNAQ